MLAVLPVTTRFVIERPGHRASEPEIKFLLVVLFGVGALAVATGSEAVLPAYIAGLVIAGVFLHDRVLIDRMRSICFALLTHSSSCERERSSPHRRSCRAPE